MHKFMLSAIAAYLPALDYRSLDAGIIAIRDTAAEPAGVEPVSP